MNEALVAIKEVADGFVKRIAELEVENAALKAEVASLSHNSAMVPYECVHGIPINEDCAVCKEYMGVDRRVIVQHQ